MSGQSWNIPQLSPLWWISSVLMGWLLIIMMIWSYYILNKMELFELGIEFKGELGIGLWKW